MKLALILLLAGSAPTMAAQNFTPTAAQIAACAPDALKLCQPSVMTGDRNLIAQCMDHARRQHRVSVECQEAFPR